MRAAATQKDVASRILAPEPAPNAPTVLQRASATVQLLHFSYTAAPPRLRLIDSASNQTAEAIRVQRLANSSAPFLASSLAVSSPRDASEREAGATANKIVRMPAQSGVAYVNTGTGNVFRLLKSPESDER